MNHSCSSLNENNLTKILLYNNNLLDDNKNQSIVMRTIGFVRRVKSSQKIFSSSFQISKFVVNPFREYSMQ